MTSSQFTGNGWWKAGGSQEGCHFDPDSESKITALLGGVLNRLEVGYVAARMSHRTDVLFGTARSPLLHDRNNTTVAERRPLHLMNTRHISIYACVYTF